MSDEKKKNRVDLGGGSDNSFNQPPVEDDYDFNGPERSPAGKMVYGIMLLLIIALAIVSFMFFKDKQQLKKNLQVVKNKLAKIEHEKNKKRYGNLHIEVEDPEKGLPEEKKTGPAGVEIYVNGELKPKASGVTITNHDISQDLIFEFKKPGYYPVKLEVKSCNWKKVGKDKYFYENRDIRLARDDNAMMAIEAAKKEKEKEEKLRKSQKKKRRR